jgi:hypothetical protein
VLWNCLSQLFLHVYMRVLAAFTLLLTPGRYACMKNVQRKAVRLQKQRPGGKAGKDTRTSQTANQGDMKRTRTPRFSCARGLPLLDAGALLLLQHAAQ